MLIAKPPLSSNAQAQPRAARSEAKGCTSAAAPGWTTTTEPDQQLLGTGPDGALLFELREGERVMRLWESGRCDGFGPDLLVNNKALSLLRALRCAIGEEDKERFLMAAFKAGG